MQRKRMKTTKFNTATWNVRSMLQAGKMEEIADQLKKYNIQITALDWKSMGNRPVGRPRQ